LTRQIDEVSNADAEQYALHFFLGQNRMLWIMNSMQTQFITSNNGHLESDHAVFDTTISSASDGFI
jgi:hypothetical protein